MAAVAVVGLLWRVRGAVESPSAVPALTRMPSLAVLPFETVGAAGDSTYFADGMTEELITQIGRVPGLRVVSRTTAFAFRNKRGLTLHQIAESLRVTTVLEGSVRRHGDSLRVIARLIDVAADSQLMTGDFNRRLTDVFKVQSEIAGAIAKALQLNLTPNTALSPRARTSDLGAYDLYLQGRALLVQRSPVALHEAASRFQAAIARDPSFAAAHVGLSDALRLGVILGREPRERSTRRAQRALSEALRLDSTSAAAYAGMGHIQFVFERDYRAGIASERRAISMDPNNYDARNYLAIALADLGEYDEAIDNLRQVLERDPLNAPVLSSLSRTLFMAGQLDEAIERADAAIAVSPQFSLSHLTKANALLAKGRIDEGVASFRRAVRLSQPRASDSAFLAYGLAVQGDRAESRRILRALNAGERDDQNLLAVVGLAYLALGERDEALSWFERHVQGNGGPVYLRYPATVSIRDDPRFKRVMEALAVRRPLVK